MMEQQGDEEVPPDNSGGFEQQDVNISEEQTALKRKSPIDYGSEKKSRIEEGHEQNSTLNMVDSTNPNSENLLKPNEDQQNGNHEIIKTDQRPVSPVMGELNGKPGWKSESEMTISEKLREMDEISVQPVSKSDIKKSSMDEVADEVSVEITRKSKLDDPDGDAKHKVTNLRKNIREVMDETKLDASTLAAQREESERLARVQEQQKILRALQRQNNLDKVHDQVLSLLTEAKGSVVGNLTPSVSIAPVRVLDKKTGQILEEVPSVGEIIPDTTLKSVETEEPSETVQSEEKPIVDSKPIVSEKKEVVTIDDSSDDDCILLSDDDEEDEGDEDPHNCGLHVNDSYNVPDEQGRVLVNVGHPDNEPDIFVAPQIARVIKPHQIGGVRFLYDNIIESLDRFDTSTGFGCILAHSMGLGKTLQLVTFCDIFLRHTNSKTILCIMPINTLQNWMAEFNMWLPEDPEKSTLKDEGDVRSRNFKIHILNDSHKSLSARSKVVLNWSKVGGVLMIGYEMYRLLCLKKAVKKKGKRAMRNPILAQEETDAHNRLLEEIYQALVKPGPDLVVCDEGHRIKNSHASTSVALKQIRSKRRIVLTGYPLQNNLLEYWCMVDFVRPNYLGTKTEFCNMFEKPIQNGQCIDSTPQDIKLMRYRAHVLHSLLLGFVQRRSHIVLQTSLPKKQEYVLLVRMTDFQRSLYDVFMNEVVRIKAVPNPLKAFAVCCKIWNHPDVLYNFLKKRELDLDLELEEEAALEAVKNNNKNKTDKIDIKTEPEKVEIKSEKSNEATEETVKIKTESTPEASSTSQLTELKPIGGEKSVIPNYNNYSNQYSYQQFNNQYNPNEYYDNYNNQSYQQVNPNAGPTPDQNYYNNQYYNQSYGAPKTSYWSNESTYFNQNSYPEASKNYNYQTGTYLGQEANQFQYNNGSAPEAVKPFVEDQKPVIPQENPPPSQELEPGEIPQKALSPDSKSPAKESPEKEIHTKSNRDDGIPYEWATELMLGYVPDLLENSPKMEIFFCILEESLNMGDRTLVFSQSLLTLNLIESYLQRTKVTGKDVFWAKNTNYFRLDGSTSACDREKLINEFNANPNICLFLVSTRAGSLGINLVGANRVIVFDASWNPCHDTQAVCRVYRYGQQKPCFVYRLVMDNCLEKRIYDRQVNKQGMSDRVVDECNPDARLSIKEVTNLCWDDDKESEVKDFSEIKDKYDDLVMQQVLSRYPRSLSKEPFRHESLLVDRKEKKLSSAEKRLAQRGYELEKKASAKPSYNYTPTGKVTQYRVFRTADGTLVHRPLASVQPLQSENSNVRWIPAEVWQRQGMSTQETTLPADVVIPSNSEDKSGGFVLKAGQKVMILKSSKGIYMQLESGKIIAIKTGSKPKVNTLPNRSNPVRNGCHSDEIVNLDDDDDDEEEGEIKGESSKTKSKPDENAGSSKVPIPTESTNSQNPVENRSIHPVENKHVNLATPQQQTYSNPPIVADPGYSHSFNTQYRQQVYSSQYPAYNNNNSVPIKQENVQPNYSHSYQATPQQMSEYPQQQQNTSRVVDNSRKIEPVRETAPVNYYNQYQQQQTSYPIENQRQYAPTNVPERSNQYYAPPEKPLYQQHPSQIGQFPAPVANNMYNNANSQQNFYNSRPTTTTNQQYPNLVNQNTNSQVIPPVSTVLTGSYDKSLRRDPTPSHQTPLPGEYNPNHPPYYATPISGNSYNMNQYHQEIPPSTAPIAYQQNYYGDYNGQHNPQHQQPVRPTDNMRGGSNQAKKKPSSTKPLKSAEPVIKTEPHKSVVSAFHKPFEQTQIAVPSRKPAEKSENSRQKSSDFSVSSLTKPLPSSEYQYPTPIPPTANTYPYPASSTQYPIVPPMPTYDFPPFYYPNYTTAGTSSSTTPSLASKGYAGQHTMDSTHYPFSPNSSRSFPTN